MRQRMQVNVEMFLAKIQVRLVNAVKTSSVKTRMELCQGILVNIVYKEFAISRFLYFCNFAGMAGSDSSKFDKTYELPVSQA